MMLLEEPLEEELLFGVGRQLAVFDVLWVTLTDLRINKHFFNPDDNNEHERPFTIQYINNYNLTTVKLQWSIYFNTIITLQTIKRITKLLTQNSR